MKTVLNDGELFIVETMIKRLSTLKETNDVNLQVYTLEDAKRTIESLLNKDE